MTGVALWCVRQAMSDEEVVAAALRTLRKVGCFRALVCSMLSLALYQHLRHAHTRTVSHFPPPARTETKRPAVTLLACSLKWGLACAHTNAFMQVWGDAVPPPVRQYVTRWQGNPYARGAYSFMPVDAASPQDIEELARPVSNHVFFGEIYGAQAAGVRVRGGGWGEETEGGVGSAEGFQGLGLVLESGRRHPRST